MNLLQVDLKIKLGTLFDNKLWKYHYELLLGLFLVKSCALSKAFVRRCLIKKCFLNNFVGKHLCRSLFLDKAAGC